MGWVFQAEYVNQDDGGRRFLAPDLEAQPESRVRFAEASKALGESLEAAWPDRRVGRDSAEFPFFGAKDSPGLLDGWRWEIPPISYTDQLINFDDEIIDIVAASYGSFAISEKVIEIIERIEPGTHQYLPYELIRPDGTKSPEKRWLLNICTRVEAIDVDKSDVVVMNSPRRPLVDRKPGAKKIVLRKSLVEGRALWCEWRYSSASNVMASDRLWSSLRDAGVRGWMPHEANSRCAAEL